MIAWIHSNKFNEILRKSFENYIKGGLFYKITGTVSAFRIQIDGLHSLTLHYVLRHTATLVNKYSTEVYDKIIVRDRSKMLHKIGHFTHFNKGTIHDCISNHEFALRRHLNKMCFFKENERKKSNNSFGSVNQRNI